MKVSFITTILNEESEVTKLINSLLIQTRLPDDVVIVDGGSRDDTIARIRNYESGIRGKKLKVNLLIKPGNRSMGRNQAVRKASGDIIVCSDSGNILDKKWIENITKPFTDSGVDVVAGYYKGLAKNIFQRCLIPYVLVMPDKVDPMKFLPATRSIAFKKSVWKRVGGFDEKFSHNEDYVFAKRLKNIDAKIVFAKNAVVNWIPRNSYKDAFVMFFRFALGDAESKTLRPKVIFLFMRYLVGLLIMANVYISKSFIPIFIFLILLVGYFVWAIGKNYKYVKNSKAIFHLPLLQFTSDIAVMLGTFFGAAKTFLVKWIGAFLFLSGIIFLSFRYIRNLFPIPRIGNEKIIGYAQYYGYPFYFDTILFFIFIFLPVFIFVILTKFIKDEK